MMTMLIPARAATMPPPIAAALLEEVFVRRER